jgi:N-methylhydantoinase A/oxoprolinase/acetone carboxylase beta subunit
MRIGVDVGGTNTDAVVLDGNGVVAATKTPTTEDVTTGIIEAIGEVIRASGLTADSVDAVMIGTTHFTNAVVQQRDLAPVAALRLALPSGACLPPMVDWPPDLLKASAARPYVLHGGLEFDGSPIAEVQPAEIDSVARDLEVRGIRNVAVTSVFSPVDPSIERRVGALLTERIPDLDVTYSHEIGRLGLLERENAAVLNAALRPLAARTIEGFRRAINQLGLNADVYLTQNDGTLMQAEFGRRYPVLTFSSGPTNSMRGAAYLSGLDEAIVVDIGGTTTDVGALTRGFPREASLAVDIGGVRTNFRMPDVISVGLGGGSVVRPGPHGVEIGPDSVGFRIVEDALVFGGSTLTATDVVVAAGLAEVGDLSRVRHLAPELVTETLDRMRATIDETIDRMKLSADPVTVVVVGGGRILAQGPMAAAGRVVVPPHHAVANAIGAAIAQVSGEVDRVMSLSDRDRQEALEEARRGAEERAIAAGAKPDTLRVVDVEDIPLTYLPGNAVRIRVKVVGDLAVGGEHVADR